MRGILAAAVAALLIAAMPAGAAAAQTTDEQALIVAAAQQSVGARFRLGTAGPTTFDCSGFVWYTFSEAGLSDKIGGKRLRAKQYQKWFRDRGLLSRDNPRVGDVVFYGNPAKHSGIVTGIDKKGRARVTSALTSGVRETKYNTLDVPFDAFGHVGLGIVQVPDPTPDPTPEPTLSP